MKRLQKVMLIPDVHAPFHDKRAWNLVLKAGKAMKPDIIAQLGDLADFYCVSDHDKDPNRARNLESEIESVRQCLADLKSLGAKRNIYISGNHEWRLDRYLMKKAPELFNMMQLPQILRLTESGWEWVPYKSHITIGKLNLTHDIGKSGAGAHLDAMQTFQDNAALGHTHRLAVAYGGNARGRPHVAAMFGWLGDRKKVDYMHAVRANRDWMQGIGWGHLEPNGVIHLQAIPIIDYKMVIDGRLFEGKRGGGVA